MADLFNLLGIGRPIERSAMNARFAMSAPSSVRNTTTLPDEAGDRAALDGAVVTPGSIGQGIGARHARLAGAMNVARYHGVDLDPHAARLDATEIAPSARVLEKWLRDSGLWARSARLTFRHLMEIESAAPILLLLSDGGAALVGGRNRERGGVIVRGPRAPNAEPVPVDELRLKQVWNGSTVLVRGGRDGAQTEAPSNLGLLTRLVWGEKSILRDVALGSISVTILSVMPVLMIMTTLNIVVMYQSINTL